MSGKNGHNKLANEKNFNERILGLATQIVAAHVSNNTVTASELPALIAAVYQSMLRLCSGASNTGARIEPAVPVNRSITPDYIICLEDGKKLKMLKRHIKAVYNLTPDQYRERWGLPADYPMVAPNYAKKRSKLAKQTGLGAPRYLKK